MILVDITIISIPVLFYVTSSVFFSLLSPHCNKPKRRWIITMITSRRQISSCYSLMHLPYTQNVVSTRRILELWFWQEPNVRRTTILHRQLMYTTRVLFPMSRVWRYWCQHSNSNNSRIKFFFSLAMTKSSSKQQHHVGRNIWSTVTRTFRVQTLATRNWSN